MDEIGQERRRKERRSADCRAWVCYISFDVGECCLKSLDCICVFRDTCLTHLNPAFLNLLINGGTVVYLALEPYI
jgi:hypothetical protein